MVTPVFVEIDDPRGNEMTLELPSRWLVHPSFSCLEDLIRRIAALQSDSNQRMQNVGGLHEQIIMRPNEQT